MKIVPLETVDHMRIQCPSCAATYEVAAGLLDQPRTVRCAQCGNDWLATPMANAPREPTEEPTGEAPEESGAVPAEPAAAEPPLDPSPYPPSGHTAGANESALAFDDEVQQPHAHVPGPGTDHDGAEETSPLSALERLSTVDHDEAVGEAHRRDRYLMIAWAASFLLLLAFGVLLYMKRSEVMEAWPASKRVYIALGLAQPQAANGEEKH